MPSHKSVTQKAVKKEGGMKVMGRRRRSSDEVVSLSKIRLSAVQQIDTTKGRVVDYGGVGRPLRQSELQNKIAECELLNANYNKLLEEADKALNHILLAEKQLSEMYAQVLKGAVAEFGADADEVEMLGGTRKSERKRPVRKSK